MKNPLIQLPPDRVTISDQGRVASKKWKVGDKPFIQILEETERNPSSSQIERNAEQVDPIRRIGDESESSNYGMSRKVTRLSQESRNMILDIGSRLELDSFPETNNMIIRSITRVNLNNGNSACETHWEVIPEDI
ncbi:hypothetical protein CEE37_03385 [candidate division LCP-89 bacterium B3_LCP]|uniref:Uncharacterized protein n=1 Tax=candidate division LCP-89 bacterium B3_LCP TaxID=2012998 RepID=A0A532V3B9_UNCL8|nr:MAG: hypothetical protein CEE37_03385 [candidate division LCP-89 bacterium B3_LCP]